MKARKKLYLIFARELNRFKIGYSVNPEKRLAQLMTGSPTKLELFAFASKNDAPGSEKSLHDQFSSKRIIGEWFHLDPIDYINILKQWNYDPGIHYSKRTVDNLIAGKKAYISWDSRSLCEVEIVEVDDRNASVEIVAKIGRGAGVIGDIHSLFLDEVRFHPLDALLSRVTL